MTPLTGTGSMGAWVSDDVSECGPDATGTGITFKMWFWCDVGSGNIWALCVSSPSCTALNVGPACRLDLITVSCDPFEIDFSDGQNSRFSSSFCVNGIFITITR